MKTISSRLSLWSILLLLTTITAPAQQEPLPDVGFVRVISLLNASRGKTHIIIDGSNIYPAGYDSGQKTGGIGLKVGPHTISLHQQGLPPVTAQFTLNRGETLTWIGYAEKVVSNSPNDPPLWRNQLLPVKQSDSESGDHLILVSLCPQDEIQLQIQTPQNLRAQTTRLKRLLPNRLDLSMPKTEFALKIDDTIISHVSLEDPGNYQILLYADEAGKIRALSFDSPNFTPAG